MNEEDLKWLKQTLSKRDEFKTAVSELAVSAKDFYDALIHQGFSENQSFTMTNNYLMQIIQNALIGGK